MLYEREEIQAPVRPRKRKLSNRDWADIQKAFADGTTKKELAAKYKVHVRAIDRVLGIYP